MASQEGHKDCVQLLLQAGANVNAPITVGFGGLQNHIGGTPLMIVSQQGHTECVQLLLQAEAQVNASAINGK